MGDRASIDSPGPAHGNGDELKSTLSWRTEIQVL